MTDMKEAMREAQAHATLVARAERECEKQIAAAGVRAKAARQRKIAESLDSLSPSAARIVCAWDEPAPVATIAVTAAQMQELMAERQHHGPLKDCIGTVKDDNPAPEWLNEAPPPVAPGAMIAVDEKPKARRA